MSETLAPVAGGAEADSGSAADFSNTNPTPDTFAGRMSNTILGAQTAAQEASGSSKGLDEIASDIVTKAFPLTAASIVNSFYNTATDVGNFLGGDFQRASIEDEFGPDSETTKYYQEHAGVIEGVGLAAGSLIPGLGAVKVLKLAQTGKFGAALQFSTGLASGMREEAIASATADLVGNSTGTSLFGLSSANKVKAILAGAADQALQGAVYETATLATMHASPITDNNTMADNISDVIDAAKGFGVVGGIFEGAGAFSKINKAVKAADLSSKAQEAFGSLGIANLTPGDRIVKLYETLDSIPAPTNRLESMKLNSTKTTTDRLIQDEFLKSAGGDKDLANAFRGFVEKSRTEGSLDSQGIVNNFGQLSKIGRHGDTSIVSVPNDVFYINSKVDSGLVSTATHDEVLSKVAAGDALTSRAFILNDPSILPTIGRATDMGSLPGIVGSGVTNFSKFAGAMDAYKQGMDIFVDAKGVTHINPESSVFKETKRPGESRILTKAERLDYQKTGNLPADSKPLNAVGLTLDVTNGKLYGETPLPVVGDIGKPAISGNNLRVGNNLFPQKLGGEFEVDKISPLDANARYVWAGLRGIKNSDSIHPTDLPMLEQAYKELAAGHNAIAGRNISTFSDGSAIPLDAAGMLKHIATTKQAMYGDLLSAGKNADEIGHILNAPTKGLTKNFNTLNPDELITPIENSANIRHVRLAYDIGTTKDSEGNALRGMLATNYRIKLARDAATDQVSNYLATTIGKGDVSGQKATDYFSALQFTKGAGDADIAGAGAGFLSNANGNYGTIQQQVERVGRAVSELSVARKSVVSSTLSSATNSLKSDPVAAAEYGNFVFVRHSTGENYILLSKDEAIANKLPENTAVLEGAVSKDSKSGQRIVNSNYLPPGFISGSDTTGTGLKSYYTLSQKVVDLEKASQDLNNFRNSSRDGFWKAAGTPKDLYNPDILYAPPINTSKYPFFAYVRQKEGTMLGESGASVITAKSAEELQKKISLLGPSYDTFTDKTLKDYFSAKGEYDYNRSFGTSKVNSELTRKGILNNIVPETRAENLVNDLADWHFRQEDLLLRDHVELHNAQAFSQLKAAGDRFDITGTSKKGIVDQVLRREANNPYQSYTQTALGVKKDYPLWQNAQEKLEAFGNTAFNTAKEYFGAVQKGVLPVEEADKLSQRFGLGRPYGTALEEMSKSYYGGLANQLPEPRIFSRFVATANTILGATSIRLDTFQQLIEAVTLPIMTVLEHTSAKKDLAELLEVTHPGTGAKVPGVTKSLFNAVGNFFGKDSEKLSQMYSATGLTRDELSTYRNMIDELSMPNGVLSKEGWAQKIDKATQLGEKVVGSKFTNRFTHFLAADVGRQLGEASGQSGRELLDTIGTFTNRVLGSIPSSQRAGVFSGPVGQALGLFQSYQWNMMQQLLRHIGDGDVKAISMAAGLQSSIFGIQSLPGFSALNSMIANRHGNTEGADIYSGAASMLTPEVSNYLLYGGLSGLLGTSLYTRGDLNPRTASIIPLNPLQFPSVQAGMKIYSTLAELQNNITTKGGNVPASLLLAAEHNSLSRPLSGLAQLAQGYTTLNTGQLVSKLPGLSELSGISTMSRIFGARPLEEGVAMDAMYRYNALKVTDTARLNELGKAAMTSMYADSPVAPEVSDAFLADYVKAGGRQEHFNSWFMEQSKKANTSAVNKVMENYSNPLNQGLQQQMGGIPLPDYHNAGSIELTGGPGTEQ